MQLSNTGSETPRSKPSEMAETNIVTQPAKLNELMEVINVMGAISEKIAEQRPMASSMQSDSSGSAKATAQSARDIAIANLPEAPVMQKNLISHIQKEIKTLEREVKLIAKERKLGWAYEATKVFARIRRLTLLAREITRATLETLKRFYVHVFIDNQPLIGSSSGLLAR